ncbi:MAG: ATP-binding protein, partial [Chitinophagaceae bacterium]
MAAIFNSHGMVTAHNILLKDLYHLNAEALLKEIEWFNKVLQARLQLHFNEPCEYSSIADIEPPSLEKDESVFTEFIRFYQLTTQERVVMMLALIPHVCPQLLDIFFVKHNNAERLHTEFGGLKGSAYSGFLPTGETALFLLAGNDIGKRFKIQQLFDADHVFRRHNIVYLAPAPSSEPFFCGQLMINDEYVDLLTGGKIRKPVFSMDFPAKRIITTMDWHDLVLDEHTF